MPDQLEPRDIVQAIHKALRGEWTRPELGRWAFQAQQDDDTGRRPFRPSHRDELHDAIYDLMFMEEGPEYDLTDDELMAMVKRLEALDEPRSS